MFGYIKVDEPYLYMKDDTLYKSLYCGVCKAIGSCSGQVARFTLTYDIAFLSCFAHNLMGEDVAIKKERCVIHPIKKRPIASRDALTEKLAAINVILAKNKVMDDVYDSGKGKFKSAVLNKGYKRAVKKFPEVDKIVKERYQELTELEKNQTASVDMVSHPFSVMLSEISKNVFGEFATEKTDKLFYYVGKWIYLADALDDYDKDVKKKEYNVFYVSYKEKNAKELLEKNGDEICFIFNDIFNGISENLANIKFKFNSDLIKNILLRGIPSSFNKIVGKIMKNEK